MAVNFKTGLGGGQCNLKNVAAPNAVTQFDAHWAYLRRVETVCANEDLNVDGTGMGSSVGKGPRGMATAAPDATADLISDPEVNRGTTTTEEPYEDGSGRLTDINDVGKKVKKESKTKTKNGKNSRKGKSEGFSTSYTTGTGRRNLGVAAAVSVAVLGLGFVAVRAFWRSRQQERSFDYDYMVSEKAIESDCTPLVARSPQRTRYTVPASPARARAHVGEHAV